MEAGWGVATPVARSEHALPKFPKPYAFTRQLQACLSSRAFSSFFLLERQTGEHSMRACVTTQVKNEILLRPGTHHTH